MGQRTSDEDEIYGVQLKRVSHSHRSVSVSLPPSSHTPQEDTLTMNEPDDVGTVPSVTESTVTVNLATADDNLGGEPQAEEPSCKGDGGEITVEVVDSDVFIDSLGGHGGKEDLNSEGVSDGLAKEGSGRETENVDGEHGGSRGFQPEEVGDLGGNVSDDSDGTRVGNFEKETETIEREHSGSDDLKPEEIGDLGGKIADALAGAGIRSIEKVEVVNEEGLERSKEPSKEVDDSYIVATLTWDGETQNSGIETGAGASSMISGNEILDISTGTRVESCEKVEVIVNKEVLEISNESCKEVDESYVVTTLTAGVLDGEAQKSEIVTELGASSMSLDGQVLDASTGTVVESFEKLEVIVNKEVLEGSNEPRKEVDDSDVIVTLPAGVSDGEAQQCANETGVNDKVLEASTGTGVESFEKVEVIIKDEVLERSNELSKESGETHVVEEEITVMDGEEGTERGLNEEIVERTTVSVHEEADALDHLTLHQESVLVGEASKTGREAEVLGSSKISESLTAQTQLVLEEVALVVKQEGLNSNEETADRVFSGRNLLCSEIDHSSSVEVVYAGIGEGHIQETAENLDKQSEPVGGEHDAMNKEERSHSTLEVTKTDVSDGNLHLSVEQETMKIKAADDISASCTILSGDLISFPDTSKPFAGGGIERGSDKVSSNPIAEAPTDHCLSEGSKTEEVIMAFSDSISPIAQSEVAAIDTQVSVSDSADHGPGGGEVLRAENRTVGSSAETISKVDAVRTEPESSNNQTLFANANEVTAMDNKFPISKVEVPTTGEMDGYPASSKNFEDVKCETACANAVEHGVPGIDEGVEDEGMDIDEVLGWKDVVPGIDALGGSVDYSGNDQDSKVDGSSKTDERGRLESSCEAILVAHRGNVASVNKEDPKFEAMVEINDKDVANNHSGLDSLEGNLSLSEVDGNLKPSSPLDSTEKAGIVEADFRTLAENVLVAREETIVMDEKQGLNSGCENLDGDTGKEGITQANAQSSGQQAISVLEPLANECQGNDEVPQIDALDGSSSPSAKDEKLNVETLGSSSAEDIAVCTDPSQGVEAGDPDSSNLGTNSATFEENKSMQDEEQEVGVQQAETVTYEGYQSTDQPIIDEILNEETCSMAPLDRVAEVGGGSQDATSQETGNIVQLQVSDCLDGRGVDEFTEVGLIMGKEVEVEEQCGQEEQVDFLGEQETETQEHITEAEQLTGIDEEFSEPLKTEISGSVRQSCYFQPPEKEGEFCVSDLVWGKARGHPWWPGQVFDPADASEKAMKYHKKDCFLVAYFGERTFAWNDAAVLKPFRTHYSQIAKHSNLEAFHHAVSSALEEVSRRVELGLACSCIPQDFYAKIESQVVENTGISQEASRRHGADKSAGVSSFEPDKLLNYVRASAQSPNGEGDQLELAIAKALLSSYCRYKGYRQPPEFQFCGELLEIPADTSDLSEAVEHTAPAYKDGEQMSDKGKLKGEYDAPHKHKGNLMDSAYPNKKLKSLSELMDDTAYSTDDEDGPDGKTASKSVSSSTDRKRKALDSVTDGSEKIPSLDPAKVSSTIFPTPKPSFKVGECIRRVASQLTGSPSILKDSGEKFLKVEGDGDHPSGFDVSVQTPESSQRGRMVVPADHSSPAEMLSQLLLAAQDPMKGYGFLNTIIPFFSSYRTKVVSSKSRRQNSSNGKPGGARKRKASNDTLNSPEEFEFDDVNDSYWTDRIIQNYSEEQLLQDSQNGGGEYQLVAFEPDKPVKPSRKSRKRYFNSHEIEAVEPEHVDRRKQNLPTEVVLNFTEGVSVPSEMKLNKMFRRFGPLMESETEVDRQTSRARVVFKKCSDAEVAFSSAGKFNIFGSLHVNYELNYNPLVSYKPLPLQTLLNHEDAT